MQWFNITQHNKQTNKRLLQNLVSGEVAVWKKIPSDSVARLGQEVVQFFGL